MVDDNFQKLEKLIEVVKEITEVTNDKVEKIGLFMNVTSGQVRMIKDQQSVINKKLDALGKDLKQVRETQDDRLLPLVVTIENEIKVYSDMYKLNNDNMKKLEKRLEVIEDQTVVTPDPEFI